MSVFLNYSRCFKGISIKINIISGCNGGYRSRPNKDVVAEQRITVNSQGRVWISTYIYGITEDYQLRDMQQFKIDANAAGDLLNFYADYFRNDYDEWFATDIGMWQLKIFNSDGRVFTYKGSMCAQLEVDGVDLSDLTRHILYRPGLHVFDGLQD